MVYWQLPNSGCGPLAQAGANVATWVYCCVGLKDFFSGLYGKDGKSHDHLTVTITKDCMHNDCRTLHDLTPVHLSQLSQHLYATVMYIGTLARDYVHMSVTRWESVMWIIAACHNWLSLHYLLSGEITIERYHMIADRITRVGKLLGNMANTKGGNITC